MDSDRCALITRENRIHVFTFTAAGDLAKVQYVLSAYQIFNLMGRNQNDLFALGTRSTDERILLLKIRIPTDSDLEIQVVGSLEGLSSSNNFVSMLTDESDDYRHVVVASWGGTENNHVYSMCP